MGVEVLNSVLGSSKRISSGGEGFDLGVGVWNSFDQLAAVDFFISTVQIVAGLVMVHRYDYHDNYDIAVEEVGVVTEFDEERME
jgi:hypothetical protein